MGLMDSLKGMFSGKKGAQAKAQAQKVAQKVDDQAAKLAEKDGVVGTVVSVVDVVAPLQPLPRLPVARAMWRPRPDLTTNAAAWIHGGGSHHTSLGYPVTPEHLADFAAMSGVEFLLIDEHTDVDSFRDRLRWNDLFYLLSSGR